MGHTYASVAQLKAFIKDGGDAATGGLGTVNDAQLLGLLEDVSRAIDAYCERTGAGHPSSGFGPRVGTNRYDGPGGSCLDLDDDLISITSVSVAPAWGASPATYVDETDFLKGPYDRTPYRELQLVPTGQSRTWYAARRGVSVTGVWGYSNDTVASSATLAEDLDTSELGVDVSSGPAFSLGQTLLLDTEQLYVRAIASNTCTVDRGANGTTPAAHTTGAAIAVYRYPSQVVGTALRLALRRWKSRDAGLTGVFGGGPIPVTQQPDPSETSILRGGLLDLALARLT